MDAADRRALALRRAHAALFSLVSSAMRWSETENRLMPSRSESIERTNRLTWDAIQSEEAACISCRGRFDGINVVCPPGALYPPPPADIRTLFVGVAPPRPGDHFYTSEYDKLRAGLFAVLTGLGFPCRAVPEFLAQGFFLTHTAKCPIAGTSAPDRKVSVHCSKRFLAREIDALQPRAVCILSKGIGPLVATRALGIPTQHGVVVDLPTSRGPILFLVTSWPGRGWEADTRDHLAKLLVKAASVHG
jgi:Uracil DNA glycosylase superfamily